jgi:hypothetical protein
MAPMTDPPRRGDLVHISHDGTRTDLLVQACAPSTRTGWWRIAGWQLVDGARPWRDLHVPATTVRADREVSR